MGIAAPTRGDIDTVTRGDLYTGTRVRRALGQLSGKRKRREACQCTAAKIGRSAFSKPLRRPEPHSNPSLSINRPHQRMEWVRKRSSPRTPSISALHRSAKSYSTRSAGHPPILHVPRNHPASIRVTLLSP